MPLGRLSAYVLVIAADDVTSLPLAAALQGPIAVLLGMVLVYFLVARELGHGFYGLVAMILFGVTLKYNEAVFWYAASFAVLALDTTLLALLSAQRWRLHGRAGDLALAALWSGLAPGWFAIGVLAGPLCCLYLVPGRSQMRQAGRAPFCLARFQWLVPLAGTAFFLALSVPQNLHAIQHAEHFQGKSATEAFQPGAGLALSARILVDNLVFGFIAFGVTCPPLAAWALVLLLALAVIWWGRRALRAGTRPQFLLLALGLIVIPYLLTYSFRAAWPYEQMMARWTRYNLFPYLGLVLLVCAGLPSRHGTLFQLDASGALTRRQAGALALLTFVLFSLQFPTGLAGYRLRDPAQTEQMACLTDIQRMDERCADYGIAGQTARQALGRLHIPHSGDPPRISGWELLRGSPSPRPVSPAEARALLLP
jgi:hypothetical protein